MATILLLVASAFPTLRSLKWAYTAIHSITNIDDQASQEKPFRFLDLPHELQDQIIEHYYAKRTFTISYAPDPQHNREPVWNPSRLIVVESLGVELLRANKHIYTIAKPIESKSEITLCISHYHNIRYTWVTGMSDIVGKLKPRGMVEGVNNVVLLGYRWQGSPFIADCSVLRRHWTHCEKVFFASKTGDVDVEKRMIDIFDEHGNVRWT